MHMLLHAGTCAGILVLRRDGKCGDCENGHGKRVDKHTRSNFALFSQFLPVNVWYISITQIVQSFQI